MLLCTAFRGGANPNLSREENSKQVLSHYEWGHDDYSLQIENLPKAPAKQRAARLLDNGMRNDRHVNAIAGRLSLRALQRRSLEILNRLIEIVPPKKGAHIAAALEIICNEFPSVTDFERDFPVFCAGDGLGKTLRCG